MVCRSSLAVKDIAKNIGVPEDTLDQECSEEHVKEISRFLESWDTLAPHLNLAETDIEEIKDEKPLPVRRRKTLKKWKNKFINRATYRVLMEAMYKIGKADNARSVCKLLSSPAVGIAKHVGIPTNGSAELDGAVLNTPSAMDGVSSTNKAFPQQNDMPSEEAPQIKTSLPETLEDKIHSLEEDFGEIVDRTASDIENSIENHKTSLSKVKRRITQLPVSMKHLHIKFLAGKLSAINNAKNVDEFFSILGLYWDFMNCGLLQQLVNRFGSSETQQRTEEYLKRLKEFRTDTTRSFILNAEILQPLQQFLQEQGVLRVLFKGVCILQQAQVVPMEGTANGSNTPTVQRDEEYEIQISRHMSSEEGKAMEHLVQHIHEQQQMISGQAPGTDDQLYQEQEVLTLQQQDPRAQDLFRACIDGDLDKVLELLTTGVEVDCRDEEEWTPLALASRYGHIDLVHVLLANKADVNARNEDRDTVLHWACVGGYSNVVEVLLQEGAEVDSRNEADGTPLMYASSNGHTAVVKLLLNARADVNLQVLDKSTALIKASDNGYSKVVQLLLAAHADVNTQNQDGTTALMEACSRGYRNVVDLLLGGGADPSLQDQNGETALLKASYFCHSEIVQRLLHDGANVNTETENGLNALMLTVKSIDPEVEKQLRITRKARLTTVEVLLDANAASTKRTALFFAVTDGDLDLVRLLLHYGADCKIIDEEGVTAWDVARVHGHYDICKELEKYGQERPPVRERKQSIVERVQTGGQRTWAMFTRFVQERILNRKDKTKNLKSAKKLKSSLTTAA